MSSCPCPGPLGPAPPGVGEGFKPSPTMLAGEQACGNPGSGAGLRYAPDGEPEATPSRRGGFQTLPYYNAGRRTVASPGHRSGVVADCDPGLRPGRRGGFETLPYNAGRRAGARGAGVQDRRPLFSDRPLRQAQDKFRTPAHPASDRNDIVGRGRNGLRRPGTGGSGGRDARRRRCRERPGCGGLHGEEVPGTDRPEKRRAAQAAALQHILGLRTPLGVPISGSRRPRRQRHPRSWR